MWILYKCLYFGSFFIYVVNILMWWFVFVNVLDKLNICCVSFLIIRGGNFYVSIKMERLFLYWFIDKVVGFIFFVGYKKEFFERKLFLLFIFGFFLW